MFSPSETAQTCFKKEHFGRAFIPRNSKAQKNYIKTTMVSLRVSDFIICSIIKYHVFDQTSHAVDCCANRTCYSLLCQKVNETIGNTCISVYNTWSWKQDFISLIRWEAGVNRCQPYKDQQHAYQHLRSHRGNTRFTVQGAVLSFQEFCLCICSISIKKLLNVPEGRVSNLKESHAFLFGHLPFV